MSTPTRKLQLAGGTLTGALVGTKFGNANTDSTYLLEFSKTSASNYSFFKVNSTTQAHEVQFRLFRLNNGSNTLTDGDYCGSFTFNTMTFLRGVATANVTGGYSTIDLLFSSYNAGGTLAERWRFKADGELTCGASGDVGLARNGAGVLEVNSGTAGTLRDLKLRDIVLTGGNLAKSSGTAFSNGAGASAGTLANAPAAGDPTKWIPIDDNGTTRYIPAW